MATRTRTKGQKQSTKHCTENKISSNAGAGLDTFIALEIYTNSNNENMNLGSTFI